MKEASELITALANFLTAIVWPALIAVAFFVYRTQVGEALGRLTSLTLPGGFEAKLREVVAREASQLQASKPAAMDASREVTPADIQASARVRALTDERPQVARLQMTEAAHEYIRTRSSRSPGDSRTRAMELVVSKMRTLALSCLPYLDEFAESTSPGERLAATAILQVQPQLDFIEWLRECFPNERPFVQYHMAVALLAAARTGDSAWEAKLTDAVGRCMAILTKRGEEGSDRWRVLDEALKEVQRISQTPMKG